MSGNLVKVKKKGKRTNKRQVGKSPCINWRAICEGKGVIERIPRSPHREKETSLSIGLEEKKLGPD